ncbi:MAG TPA: hypothetical protein VMT58_09975 [Candidatus Binataceae bacterium]|nr:hypothetical protein [Candidatus Binataceae bacterium]
MPIAVFTAAILSSCSPSSQYRYGNGFYSEQFSREQVTKLDAQGKVKHLAEFTTTRNSCLNYSESTADNDMVIPAAQEGLRRWSGNAADHISVKRDTYAVVSGAVMTYALPVGFDFIYYPLGCEYLVISENVLKVTP